MQTRPILWAGLSTVLLACASLGLMTWEWFATGTANPVSVTVTVLLFAGALTWPFFARAEQEDEHGHRVNFSKPSCAQCGATWNGYPAVQFCMHCGCTSTGGTSY